MNLLPPFTFSLTCLLPPPLSKYGKCHNRPLLLVKGSSGPEEWPPAKQISLTQTEFLRWNGMTRSHKVATGHIGSSSNDRRSMCVGRFCSVTLKKYYGKMTELFSELGDRYKYRWYRYICYLLHASTVNKPNYLVCLPYNACASPMKLDTSATGCLGQIWWKKRRYMELGFDNFSLRRHRGGGCKSRPWIIIALFEESSRELLDGFSR